MGDAITRALDRVSSAFDTKPDASWIVAFSGGKDSTALLKLFVAAAMRKRSRQLRVNVIYCDTGVENVAIDQYVKSTFQRLESDAGLAALGFRFNILKAEVPNRFFVKIVGRGYPPPTSFFRWCTKELRIKPVEQFIKAHLANDAIVCLGTRANESQQRSRNISSFEDPVWQTQTEGKLNYPIFAPIVDFDLDDVWDTVFAIPYPAAINNDELEQLYRGASGECPTIKSPTAPPCGSGRFGCWTCTVVRQDRSAIKLVEAGYHELAPFLTFRDWLAIFRNDPANRWPHRRNGVQSPGPFTLTARQTILTRVRDLESQTGQLIINDEEMAAIEALWHADKAQDDVARLAVK